MDALIIVLAVCAALCAVMYAVTNAIFNVAVGAKKSKSRVHKKNARKADGSHEDQIRHEDGEWLIHQHPKLIRTRSRDGLALAAHILQSDAPAKLWAVVIHGFSGNGLTMATYARWWHDRGFNVLLPDLRGCGKSEGKYYGMGWPDRLDIIRWIKEKITAEQPDAKVVLHGVSMGGATVMMTTGEELPPNVCVAVEDCGYTSVWDEFTYQLKKVYGFPSFPFMPIANRMAIRRAGYSFKKASSVNQLKKSRTPTLFIHGDSDTYVPSYMLEENVAAAACEKERLLVRGAQHTESAFIAPELYWNTVRDFVFPRIGLPASNRQNAENNV